MVIRQGDVFWLERPFATGSEQAGRRPYVVVQNDLVNSTRIGTIIVCALTSNLERARARGNVLLTTGEANLPRESVVNVSQVLSVSRDRLLEKLGRLDAERVRQIVDGIQMLIEPRAAPDAQSAPAG